MTMLPTTLILTENEDASSRGPDETQFIITTEDGSEISLTQEEAHHLLTGMDTSNATDSTPRRISFAPDPNVILDNATIMNGTNDSFPRPWQNSDQMPLDNDQTMTMEGIPLYHFDDQLRQLLLGVGSADSTAESVHVTVESDGGPFDLLYHPSAQMVYVDTQKAHALCGSLAFGERRATIDDDVGSQKDSADDSSPDDEAAIRANGVSSFQAETNRADDASKTSRSKRHRSRNPLVDEDDPFRLDGGSEGGFAAALASKRFVDPSIPIVRIACEMYKRYRRPRRKHILKKMSKNRELMMMSAPEQYRDDNDPAVAPTFHNYCNGAYRLNFSLVADKIENELNYYGINQATFAHFVCQRSQTRFSELLTEARVEGYYCRSKGVFEIYRRMESWLKQPLKERLTAYNQWIKERGRGSKKKGFIRKSSLAMAVKDGDDIETAISSINDAALAAAADSAEKPPSSSSSSVTTVYVNELGQYIRAKTTASKEGTPDEDAFKENASPDAAEDNVDGGDSTNDDDDDDELSVDYYNAYAFMAFDLEDEIKWFNVSRELFSRSILGRSKSRFSEIMTEAKLQPFACGSTAVVKNILLLCDWMSKPLEERCAHYLKWRLDGAKTGTGGKGLNSVANDKIINTNVTKPKILPWAIRTESGELVQVMAEEEEDEDNFAESPVMKSSSTSSKFQTEVRQSKIDFRAVTLRLERELKAYDVGLTMFMKNLIPDITLAAFSQMLKDSKAKNFVCKRRSTLEKFKLIVDWLNQSENERIQTYRMWKEPDAVPPRQMCVAALEARSIAKSVLRELIDHDLSQKEFSRNILNAPSAVLCMLLRKATEDLADVTAPKAVKALLCMKDWMELGDEERAMAYQSWKQRDRSRANSLKRYGERIRRFAETERFTSDSCGKTNESGADNGVPIDDDDDDEDAASPPEYDDDVDETLMEPVAGVVHCVEYSLYKEDGISLDYLSVGRMIEQEIDLFKVSLADVAARIVGRGEKTLATLLSHAKDLQLNFSYGKTVDTFQALAEWLEVPIESRLMTYSLWDHRHRGDLVVELSRSAHYVDPPFEFEMDLMTEEEVVTSADQDSDEVFWQMMKLLESDLEEKRCILPVFAKQYLQVRSYACLVVAFKLAKRFLVRTDQTTFAIFKRIAEWFHLPHAKRAELCHTWMRDNVDVLWRKKVEDLRARIKAKMFLDNLPLTADLPPVPSLTVLVPKPRRGRQPKSAETYPSIVDSSLADHDEEASAIRDEAGAEEAEADDELSFFASGRPKRKAAKVSDYRKLQNGAVDFSKEEDGRNAAASSYSYVGNGNNEALSRDEDQEFAAKLGLKKRTKDAKYSRNKRTLGLERVKKRLLGASTAAESEFVSVTGADGEQVLILVQKEKEQTKSSTIDLDPNEEGRADDRRLVQENDLDYEDDDYEASLSDSLPEHSRESPAVAKVASRVSSMEVPSQGPKPSSPEPMVVDHPLEKGQKEKGSSVDDSPEVERAPVSLNSPSAIRAAKSDLVCRFCDVVFVAKSTYLFHMKHKHGDAKPFHCRTCNDEFYTILSLQKHRRLAVCGKHNTIAALKNENFPRKLGLKCWICGERFSDITAIHRHAIECAKRNREQNDFSCETCGMIFEDRSSLDLHVALGEHSSTSGVVPFDCKQCDKTFPTEVVLRGHARRVHGQKPVAECPVCRKKFLHRQNLGRHMRCCHLDSRPFRCDVCERTFTEKKSLEVHGRLHTGERPYRCEKCGRTFVQKGTYNIHLKIHVEGKPYGCAKCPKTFKTDRQLKKHVRFHDVPDEKRPFICRSCARGFFSHDDLSRHILTHLKKLENLAEGEPTTTTGKPEMVAENESDAVLNLVGSLDSQQISSQILPTCHVCGEVALDKRSLFHHMLQHGTSVESCDVCGYQYQDYLDIGLVTNHRESHVGGGGMTASLANGDASSTTVSNAGGEENQIILTNDAGQIVFLQGDAAASHGRSLTFDTQAPLTSLVVDNAAPVGDSPSESATTVIATTPALITGEGPSGPRLVSVQGSDGIVYNLQLEDGQCLSELLAGNSVVEMNDSGSQMQFVVMDSLN